MRQRWRAHSCLELSGVNPMLLQLQSGNWPKHLSVCRLIYGWLRKGFIQRPDRLGRALIQLHCLANLDLRLVGSTALAEAKTFSSGMNSSTTCNPSSSEYSNCAFIRPA